MSAPNEAVERIMAEAKELERPPVSFANSLNRLCATIEAEFAALAAENSAYFSFACETGCASGDCPHDKMEDCVKALVGLYVEIRAENERLRAALEFYAEPTYISNGNRAREALGNV